MAPMAASPLLKLGSASTTYVSEEAARRVDHLVRVMFDRLDFYQETSLVLGYLPVGEEIDTIPIMREVLLSGKRLALPWLDTRASRMYFYEVDNLSSVTRGSRGLAAPPTTRMVRSPTWTSPDRSASSPASPSTARAIASATAQATTTSSWPSIRATRWASCARCSAT